jgi:hypothetical protein
MTTERPDGTPSPLGTAGRYALSFPERAVRAAAATLAGSVHETGQLLLPRFVRRSRLYEVTAKNALRIAIELVGGVEGASTAPVEPEAPGAGRLAMKKAAGNAVELGSIAAFGFSPLWLLAGASTHCRGRGCTCTLEEELPPPATSQRHVHFASVDQLLGALQGDGHHRRHHRHAAHQLSELRAPTPAAGRRGFAADAGQLAALFNGLPRRPARRIAASFVRIAGVSRRPGRSRRGT